MQQLDLTKKYALAVSGGIDSMVMLHAFANLSPRPDFFVVTINHNIRAEGASDCQFVADYCGKLNVECKVFSVDVPSYCKQNKLSEESGARILRYRVLDSLKCDCVCLAHHADDNVETILMHILRGSGAEGARGIRRQSGKYLRPLLDMTREQIEEYAKRHKIEYVCDSTNEETKYARNFIRKKVIPKLVELNPSARQNILRFADNISQDDDYLNQLADISKVVFQEQSATIPKNLLESPRPIARRVVKKTFARLGVYKDIEKKHIEAICDLALSNGGKSVDLPFNFVAVNDYDRITIEQKAVAENGYWEMPFAQGKISTPFGAVEVSQTPLPNSLRIDVDKIPQNAVFRTKKQGDTFCKFGGGTKSLKEYLIDKKIPQRKRAQLVLLASGFEVLVICGVEISDVVKVEQTSKVAYISIDGE